MKIAIYARESSDDTKKAPPIERQIERGKAWAKENGHELTGIYSDDGFSGGDWKRPDWNQCVKDAKRHNFKLLWTWNQDRLARDTEQFLWFYRNLREAKVSVFSGTEGEINMDTAGDRMKHTTLALAAEAFRLITSDKVKRAYQAKKQKGEPWGRNKKSFDIAKAIKLKEEKGYGWRRIAGEVGVSYQTVRRVLQNRIN